MKFKNFNKHELKGNMKWFAKINILLINSLIKKMRYTN